MKDKEMISFFMKRILNMNDSVKHNKIYKSYNTKFIINQEKEFFSNDYKGSSIKDYKYIEGSIPILISAPHSVKQIRDGGYKSADIYTGALIKVLGKTTNAHIIYKTHTKDDENHTDESTPYRKKIKEIIKENEIKVIIDLHGMSKDKDSDIDIGTGGSSNPNLLGEDYILSSVKNSLSSLKYSVNKYFAAKGKLTISVYCSQKLGIPTLQLEINRKYRTKDGENFSYIVNILSKMINDLNKEFNKVN